MSGKIIFGQFCEIEWKILFYGMTSVLFPYYHLEKNQSLYCNPTRKNPGLAENFIDMFLLFFSVAYTAGCGMAKVSRVLIRLCSERPLWTSDRSLSSFLQSSSHIQVEIWYSVKKILYCTDSTRKSVKY